MMSVRQGFKSNARVRSGAVNVYAGGAFIEYTQHYYTAERVVLGD